MITEEARKCVDMIRGSLKKSYDCQLCPLYALCPTGTVEWDYECSLERAVDLIESLSEQLELMSKPNMVEVVRCGECIHGSRSPWGHPTLIWCPLRDSHRNPNWFCADGKKEN